DGFSGALPGASPGVDALHVDSDTTGFLSKQTLLASFTPPPGFEGNPMSVFAYHRPASSDSIDVVQSLTSAAHASAINELATVDTPLETAINATAGPPVDLATHYFPSTSATTTLGQFDQVGEYIPNFVFTDEHGNDQPLLGYGDNLVVMSICTEWCEPCATYASNLENLSAQLGSDFSFLEVMIENNGGGMATTQTAAHWADTFGLTTVSVVTTNGDVNTLMDFERGVLTPAYPDYVMFDGTTG